MSFIARELDRIASALRQSPPTEHYRELYAAQQALSWALDPSNFRKPYETVTGTQEGLEGCSAPSHLPLS